MKRVGIFLLLVVITASLRADREITALREADGAKIEWIATDAQMAALVRWNPFSATPPKPLTAIIQTARASLDKRYGAMNWQLSSVELHPVPGLHEGKWAYAVTFTPSLATGSTTGRQAIVLQDGTLIEPRPAQR